MRYLVIFTNRSLSATGGSLGTSARFYVLEEAQTACQLWSEIDVHSYCYLWDGITWRTYNP